MDKNDVLEYLAKHEEIKDQFNSERRFWIPCISRTVVPIFKETLSEVFNCKLNCREIPPIWEFVFYDHNAEGNAPENLEAIAKRRARYLERRI